MNDNNKIAHRLALLEGVEFSPADLEAIGAEIEDNDRILAELEAFAQATPWRSEERRVGKECRL